MAERRVWPAKRAAKNSQSRAERGRALELAAPHTKKRRATKADFQIAFISRRKLVVSLLRFKKAKPPLSLLLRPFAPPAESHTFHHMLIAAQYNDDQCALAVVCIAC